MTPSPDRPLSGTARLTWVALVCAALLSGCASLTKPWLAPEVALMGLRAKELSLARQVLVARLAVRNPNDRTLPIKSMTYRLSLEGQELAQGASSLDRQIPAFGESPVDVEVIGNLLGLAPLLPALLARQTPLNWTLTGTATIADGLLTLPYRYSGQVDPREILSRAQAGGSAAMRQPEARPAPLQF
jgi:LEA14-like dessication related protein